MTRIAPRRSIAARPCDVVVDRPVTTPDGEGGYLETWTMLTLMHAAIEPATAQDLQRFASFAVTSAISHVLTAPYVAGLTTRCRLRYADPDQGERIFLVVGVSSPDERRVEVSIAAVEQLS